MPNKFFSSAKGAWTFRLATLIALCWAIYGQSLGFGFLPFDDYEFYNNPYITDGLTLKGVVHFFTHYVGPNWFPLNWISHMAVYELFGPHPWGGHLANVLLHTCNTLLLFLFLHRATGCPWRSWLAAALFAAHPLHAESVAWVTERKDVLSAFFFMLTLLAYENYVRRRGFLRYLLTFILLMLGLMAKSMLVTLPCVMLLLDFWPLDRMKRPQDLKPLLLEKLPFFLLTLLFCLIAYYGAKDAGTIGETADNQLISNATNALVSYAVYVKRLFLPFNLAFFYPHPGEGLALWKGGLAFAGIACITLLLFRQRRKRPYGLMGWLWFLGVLVPVIGIVQPGLQGMADRYAYLPFIGLYVALVWSAADLANVAKSRPVWKITAACLLLVLLGIRAWDQAGAWRNAETLATSALRNTRNNYVAHMMLMGFYGKQGLKDKAKEQYEMARAISPYYISLFHEKHGREEMAKGEYAKALAHYRQAYAVLPSGISAFNLGLAYEQLGEPVKALELVRKASELSPEMHEIQETLKRLQEAPAGANEALFEYPVRFPAAVENKTGKILAVSKGTDAAGKPAGSADMKLKELLQIFENNAIPSRMEQQGKLYSLTFSGPHQEEIRWDFRLQDKTFSYDSGQTDNKPLTTEELGTIYGMLLQLKALPEKNTQPEEQSSN